MICPTKRNEDAEILLDYCAQTLSPMQTAEFEIHLKQCADCSRLVEAQKEVWGALEAWTPAPVSVNFDARDIGIHRNDADCRRLSRQSAFHVAGEIEIAGMRRRQSATAELAVLLERKRPQHIRAGDHRRAKRIHCHQCGDREAIIGHRRRAAQSALVCAGPRTEARADIAERE